MSRHGTLLPLPDRVIYQLLIDSWPEYQARNILRSEWLRAFEDNLRQDFPQASSADRKLTARHYAPFPLAQGPNVP